MSRERLDQRESNKLARRKLVRGFGTRSSVSSCLLEESARANPDARIRPLTHVSVDRAYQAESVGRTLYLVFLLLFVALQIYE